MDLKIKIKPVVYKARTKYKLLCKILKDSYVRYVSSNNTKGTVLLNAQGYYILYNLQKYNRKNHCHIYNPASKKKSVYAPRPKYWEAHVYHIHQSIIEITGLKVQQKLRNFKITKE